ncbi:Ldh family oxidoreductase [Aquabacter cavernae]|uniref:Ldh family oxidoreductase n=1 Tax=Aquabacter cavernae TaxID=2496029 RepID=UPI000F8F4772|nr:Ldh family oxidoreductase [Aquabacter cavernae]
MPVTLTLDDARDLARAALMAAGTSPENAAITAAALVAADADGIASHGLSRLPAYADQVATGKVQGNAVPALDWTATATLRVNAGCGFAFPAVAAGLAAAAERVRETGIVGVGVYASHHAGAMGHHVEWLAERGLAGIAFTNSPSAIAPWGGSQGVFGTNPVAFAVPRAGRPPLVIDASLSKVARGKIMVAAQRGQPIPDDWALDVDGKPTTDAKAALAGTMLPVGDAKGAALVLMVEILAAALTGGQFGFEASSFFTADGPSPAIGHLFLVMDPVRLGGDQFPARLETLLGAILSQEGTRLPGDRRIAARTKAAGEGISIPDDLAADLRRRAGV